MTNLRRQKVEQEFGQLAELLTNPYLAEKEQISAKVYMAELAKELRDGWSYRDN